jgi:hypothetical protein
MLTKDESPLSAEDLHRSALLETEQLSDAVAKRLPSAVHHRNACVRLFEALLTRHPVYAQQHDVVVDYTRRILCAPVDIARRRDLRDPLAADAVVSAIASASQLLARLLSKLLAQIRSTDAEHADALAALRFAQAVTLLTLGDLARYAADLKKASSSSSSTTTMGASAAAAALRKHLVPCARLYAAAVHVCPAFGHAHNQLGLVAALLRRRDVALYRYGRALLAALPFAGARENLLGVAERVRAALVESDEAEQQRRGAPRKPARGGGAAVAQVKAPVAPAKPARALSTAARFHLLFARCVGVLVSATDFDKLDELLKRTLQHLQLVLRDERREGLHVRAALSCLWLALGAARVASRTEQPTRRAALRCGARRLLLGLLACCAEHVAACGDVSKARDTGATACDARLDACAAVLALFLDWQRTINTDASDVALPDDAEPPASTTLTGAAARTGDPAVIDYRWRAILLTEPVGDMACVALWRALWNSLPKALSAAAQRLHRRRGLWPSLVRALPDDVELRDDQLLRPQQAPLHFPSLDSRSSSQWDASEIAATRAARMHRAALWLCHDVHFSTPQPLIYRTAGDTFTSIAAEAGTPLVATPAPPAARDDDDDDDDEELIVWQPDIAAPAVLASAQPAAPLGAPPALTRMEPSMFPPQRTFDLFVRGPTTAPAAAAPELEAMPTDGTFDGVFAWFGASAGMLFPSPQAPSLPPPAAVGTSAEDNAAANALFDELAGLLDDDDDDDAAADDDAANDDGGDDGERRGDKNSQLHHFFQLASDDGGAAFDVF